MRDGLGMYAVMLCCNAKEWIALLSAVKRLNSSKLLSDAIFGFLCSPWLWEGFFRAVQLLISSFHLGRIMLRAIVGKRQRASQACDFCHGRGLRCRRNITSDTSHIEPSCLACLDYGVHCTVDRTVKKRGRKPKNATSYELGGDRGIHSLDTIRLLVRIYCDTMYQC